MRGGVGVVIAVLQSLYISLMVAASCTSCSGASDVILFSSLRPVASWLKHVAWFIAELV